MALLKSSVQRCRTGWQGIATFTDGTTLRTYPRPTSAAAETRLTECLDGLAPWFEHGTKLVSAAQDLDGAGDSLVTNRCGIIDSTIRHPGRAVQLGGSRLKGEAALRTVVHAEVTAIVSAVHVLVDVTRVYQSILADNRATAVRQTPLWLSLPDLIREVIAVGDFSARQIAMPALLEKAATGFKTSIHWFPDLDADLGDDDIDDMYDRITAARINAMTDAWIRDRSYRDRVQSFNDQLEATLAGMILRSPAPQNSPPC